MEKLLRQSKIKVQKQASMNQALSKKLEKILSRVSEQEELINKLTFDKENSENELIAL